MALRKDPSSPTVLGNDPVYPKDSCNHARPCPFVNKRHVCTAGSESCRRRFGDPRVEARFCSLHWNSTRFAAAFRGKSLYFVGDSIATQQWRSLLCLEIANISQVAQQLARKAASENIPRDVCVSLGRAGHDHAATQVCSVRATDLLSVLNAATRFRSRVDAVIVLSAFAHQTHVPEKANVDTLLGWLSLGSPPLARVVWRSREADHYGERGWNGTLETRSCAAMAPAQLAQLEEPFRLEQHAPLRRAGVSILDSREATEAAHLAHPLQCGGEPPSGYWDCRDTFANMGRLICGTSSWSISYWTTLQ